MTVKAVHSIQPLKSRYLAELVELGAVVVIVRVTGTLVVLPVNVTVLWLKLHVDPVGRLEQIDGDSVPEPVNPFSAVNVRVVEPDCPGFAIVIVAGLAVRL